jgi:RNA polymerase sigma factor (sigma-70 family)
LRAARTAGIRALRDKARWGSAPVVSEGDSYLIRALDHENVIRACLFRITRNVSDVEELLQETYARLLVAGATAAGQPRSMRSFALAVARNVAIDWLRQKRAVPMEAIADVAELDVLDEGEQLEEIVNTHQELMLLREAIARMPSRCREVFTLRRIYGLPQKRVAAELGIAEHTVERHLGRALQLLTQVLFNPPLSAPHSELLTRLTRRSRNYEDGS